MPAASPLARLRRPRTRSAPGRAPVRRLAWLVATLVVLTPAVASAVPIEDFAGYQPQRRCSPSPKPGTVALSEWLMSRYPGSGSLGISRGCGSSGVSEHKEGRAFDWAVDHSSARDRGYVEDFLGAILAPDAEGNPAALARRMGIMYLIWDDHIYASYREFEKRPYLSSGCRSKQNCSVTLRHRNHVHISLSRDGGHARTSWYHRGETPPPAPAPAPPPPPTTPTTPATPTPPAPPAVPSKPKPTVPKGPPIADEIELSKKKPYKRIRVPLDGSTWKPKKWRLRAGKKYKVTVSGLVGLGRPDQVADATCTWSAAAGGWVGTPDAATAQQYGTLDVRVNGKAVLGNTCADSHTYAAVVVPRKSKPLRVKLKTKTRATSGSLVFTISRRRTDVTPALPTYPALTPAPAARTTERGLGLLTETVQVPAAAADGVTTSQEVEAGARYRVTVSGVADLGGGVQSDGQCVAVAGQWYPQASLDLRQPGADHGNLYVGGVPFAGGPADCGTHSHVSDVTATTTGRLHLALWDPLGPAGNGGALTVTVQRLTGLANPRQVRGEAPTGDGPWTQARDFFAVALADPGGTVSTMRLRKGERVDVIARGTYTSHGVTADATCVATAGGWVPRDPGLLVEQDPLELWVDGEPLAWRPSGPSTPCADDHTYVTTYVADKSGPIRLAVLDLDHRDNAGALEVTLENRR
ncbi:MAG TPA: hypothetical protein VFH10_04320 [Nocardioides sp.]|uniref:hypothetical protein n=1 Tax=Nocardioides sp. TaxID=35761 RepID=UPI002D801F1D|nr:hypothetical protein [Nocardioides sp.]HET6651845.1 hypothetical protein [Nocardioides sp.]